MGTSAETAVAARDGAARSRWAYAALLCLFMMGVVAISFLPLDKKLALHTKGRLHEWGHLLAFGTVAFLAAKSARAAWARALLFVVSLAFGFGVEYGEHAFFHGGLEWPDVMIDAAGVIGGTLLAMLSTRQEELV